MKQPSGDEPRDRSVLTAGRLQLDCTMPVASGAHVMGILNVTPDSFYDGGNYLEVDAALRRTAEMIEEGATLIDIGGASSRPRGAVYGAGANRLPPEKELRRVLPIVRHVVDAFPDVWVSVDTFHPRVASEVIEAGAHIINDITGLRIHPELAEIVADAGIPLVLMHSVGEPGQMPHAVSVDDIVGNVRDSLTESVAIARAAGVRQLILDPGFGFGKTVSDNLALIDHLDRLSVDDLPVLVGISRKSSVGSVLSETEIPLPVSDRLFGSLGLTVLAVIRGASIVRTHDVRATVECLRVVGRAIMSGPSAVPDPSGSGA